MCHFKKIKNHPIRCPQALTIDRLEKEFGIYGTLPIQSVHTVTVPGAAAAWVDTVEVNFSFSHFFKTKKQISLSI